MSALPRTHLLLSGGTTYNPNLGRLRQEGKELRTTWATQEI